MDEPDFEYGPVSKGVYIALIALVPVIPLAFPQYTISYVVLVVFLGFGLRPLLHFSGAYTLWNSVRAWTIDQWDRKFLLKRRAQIERTLRDERYRKSRARDPRLPKRW